MICSKPDVMESTFIFAEVSPYDSKRLSAQGWDNLVYITFFCGKVFQCEGYHPMSELLHLITDWRIGSEEGHPEQTPITVSFSITNQQIVALYSIRHKELIALCKRLEGARMCEGAFPIKVYGIAGFRSMFS